MESGCHRLCSRAVVLSVLAAPALAAECVAPLGEDVLLNLRLRAARSLQPGQETSVYFGKLECCYFILPTQACVEWSLDPPEAGELEPPPVPAAPPGPFDFATPGKLRLSSSLPHGTVVTLRADVESGRRVLAHEISVYTPEANPLVGYWQETAQLACDGFVRGDTDQSGDLLLTDAVRTLGLLFVDGVGPECAAAYDSNADDIVDISDAVYTLSYLFLGGPPPPEPFPGCGTSPPGPSALSCSRSSQCTGTSFVPVHLIEELVFDADGTFTVTWFPFEVYKDYWGPYTYDLETGSIHLTALDGNYIPPDFLSLAATFKSDGRRLTLQGVSLGSPMAFQGAPPNPQGPFPAGRCGHVFERP